MVNCLIFLRKKKESILRLYKGSNEAYSLFIIFNKLESSNLFNKINDILEEQRTKVPASRLLETMAQLLEQQQCIAVDTGHFLGATNAAVAVTPFIPPIVSTGSPLENLWSYLCPQPAGLQTVVYSAKEAKEEDKVKT